MSIASSSLLGLGCPDCMAGCGSPQQLLGLGSYGKPIEWNTEPVINTYAWNRDGYWDCNDWMTWHKKVAEKYGVARANEVFMIWWNKQGFWSYANSDCMLLNRTFREYFGKAGLKLDELALYVTKPLDFVKDTSGKIIDTAEAVVKNAGDAAANTTKSAANLAKVLTALVPIAVTGIVVVAGVYVYKHYVKGNEKITVPKASLGAIKKKHTVKKVIHI